MNVIEAMKSRRPFRRQSFTDPKYYMEPIHGDLEDDYYKGVFYQLSVADILADDWEIMGKELTITQKIFWESFVKAKKNANLPMTADSLARDMAKLLGLE